MSKPPPLPPSKPMVYVTHDGKTWGPYDTAILQKHVNDRKFLPTDLANVVGSDNWQPLNTIASFPVEAQVLHVHHKEKKKTGCITWIILAGFIAMVLVGIFGNLGESTRELSVTTAPTKVDSSSPQIDSASPITNFITHYDSPPDLDDPTIRKRVLAEATKQGKLGNLGTEGHGLIYHPKDNEPYTGCLISRVHYGAVWILQCKEGKRDGLSCAWDNLWQKRFETHWKDGKRQGWDTRWFENRQKDYECNYVDGKKEGMEKSWRRDGSKHYEVNYKDGKKHGVYTLWDESGRVKNQFRFENGKSVN